MKTHVFSSHYAGKISMFSMVFNLLFGLLFSIHCYAKNDHDFLS